MPIVVITPDASILYPSPATGDYATVGYRMARAGEVRVRVWNAVGDPVADLVEMKGTGDQTSRLTVREYATGLYFYQVVLRYNDGGTSELPTEKFIVIH